MLNYTLHKDIPVPLYYQLKLQILADIKEGRLHVGDMLPPECELCKEMGISRPTVRQAMGELVAEGHLTRCKGKGTFVSAPSVRPVDARFFQGLQSFNEEMLQKGLAPSTRVLALEMVSNREDIAATLRLAEDKRLIHLSRLRSADGQPLVVVDNGLPGLPFSAVTMDNRAAIFAAVEHLYRLGHRQIGFLYNSYASGNDRERRAAYQEALLSLGCRFDPELVYSIFPTMDGARESVSSLLDRRVRFPRALVANNDSIAIGAMRAFRDRGIRIPEDISIFGFDGLPFSAVSEPPLSTVNVPCVDVGRCAVQLLHDSIRGRCSTHCKILVGTQLLIRGSTAPPGTRRNCPWLLPEEG